MRPVTGPNRRQFQRLKLAKPILGTVNGKNALVLDIGVAGAFLEHYGDVDPGDHFRLSFRWQGRTIEFDCEAVRSEVVRQSGSEAVSHSGVRFTRAIGEAQALLEDMMATFVGRILAAQRANAGGERPGHSEGEMILARLGGARRERGRGFVTYRFDGDRWSRKRTQSARQPNDGFTVAAHEDDEEIDALCETYETSDEEGRRLIRLVAELSARNAD